MDVLSGGGFEIPSHYRGELAKKSAFLPHNLYLYTTGDTYNKQWAFLTPKQQLIGLCNGHNLCSQRGKK